MPKAPTLDDLRRYAVARTLFKPTTLARAIDKLGFVQADPIRAPARAQDLILRHRVAGYRAGDLERRYARLPIDEDAFVNYGFLPRRHLALMHPRTPTRPGMLRRRRRREVLAFVRERGPTHPRIVEAHFAHGRVTNYWGGSSNATTHLLDAMHYRGLLRVRRRDSGTRIYEAVESPRRRRLAGGAGGACRRPARARRRQVRAAAGGEPGLSGAAARLRRAAPRRGKPGLRSPPCASGLRACASSASPGTGRRRESAVAPPCSDGRVRLLAPFDPIVWDRRRFALLWGWTYRFEAYTPASQRKLGYYALPLLWRDQVIGWANAAVVNGRLRVVAGYPEGAPGDPEFKRELAAERERMASFLGL